MTDRSRASSLLDADEFRRRLADALAGRVDDQTSLPCSPWDRWVLVALHRHAARQQLVERIVRECLSGSPESLARYGAFEHPDPGFGVVPGMPMWRYRFHGRGCCLTHEDGTVLDVDFDEHGSASVDPWFYERFLATKPEHGWPELLLGTDGDWSGWKASIQPLAAAGLLEGDHRVRVTPHARSWCDAVSEAVDLAADSERRRCAIALAVGDFRWSSERRAVAQQQIEDRCHDLEARLASRSGPHALACLAALRSVDPERARAAALAELEYGPIDAVLASSMALLGDGPRPDDSSAVHALLRRLPRRVTDPPAPVLRIRAARHLLTPHRRGTVPEHLRSLLLDALAEDQRASEAEAALIVYLLDAERGLTRLFAGLRSVVPLAREECAAALALIGETGLDLLRRAESSEALTVLALLCGEQPEPGPEPRGEVIWWRNEPKQVFTIEEILAAEFEERVFSWAMAFWAKYRPWLRRWDAN